jgi:hypothetical protein
MYRRALWIFLTGIAGASTQAFADVRVSDSAAALFDGAGGQSLDDDATFSAGNWWDVSAGLGETRSNSPVGTLHGTSKRAAIDLSEEGVGLRVYYKRWDATPFSNQTIGTRLSWSHSGLTLAGIAEARDFDVDYSPAGDAAGRSTAHFAGDGFGGSIQYAHAQWTVGADGIWYHFGSLSSYKESQSETVSTPGAPAAPPSILPVLPIISGPVGQILPGLFPSVVSVTPALTRSVVTLDQGALEHIVNADLARAFGNTSLHLDWTNARDAVLETTINSYSASVKQVFGDHFSGSLTAGVSDSYYGSTAFGGLALQLTF